jgi:AraC-like DNA-binding protein
MKDIRVADIASFCRCSESYISHIFTKGTHLSIHRYINTVRIEKAKEFIAQGARNFYEVADRCGFSDPNYFSYVFKSIARVTPSQYEAQTAQKE